MLKRIFNKLMGKQQDVFIPPQEVKPSPIPHIDEDIFISELDKFLNKAIGHTIEIVDPSSDNKIAGKLASYTINKEVNYTLPHTPKREPNILVIELVFDTSQHAYYGLPIYERINERNISIKPTSITIKTTSRDGKMLISEWGIHITDLDIDLYGWCNASINLTKYYCAGEP